MMEQLRFIDVERMRCIALKMQVAYLFYIQLNLLNLPLGYTFQISSKDFIR